jgi:ribosomal protein S18 acetylase RimI-like enzyme
MTQALRPATTGDVAELLDMMRSFYAEDGHSFQAEAAQAALLGLMRDPTEGRVWVIEAESRTAGYVAVTFGYSLEFLGRDAFVDELFVKPAYRGAGLGRQAVEHAEEACRELGIGALHLEVSRGNDAAQRVYRKAGFVDRSNYLMTKRLR